MTVRIYIFLGSPLSGKTTAALELSKSSGMAYVHPTTVLRKRLQVANDAELPEIATSDFHDWIIEEILAAGQTQKGVIVDGYPRDEQSFARICEAIRRLNATVIVSHIRVSKWRLLQRWLRALAPNQRHRPLKRFFVYFRREHDIVVRMLKTYPLNS